MGFWNNLGNALSEVVTKAVNIVTETVKAVGKVVVEGAKKFLQLEMEKLQAVVAILEGIAKFLGIIKPEESTEELGDKAMRADKKPEDFDSVNAYIDYLRNEIRSASKEELEKLPEEERLARQAVGASILSKAIEENKSLEIPVEFWKKVVDLGLDAKEIDRFLTKFQEAGIQPKDFLKYLKMELNVKEEGKIDSVLVNAYKELEPNLSEKEIEEKIVRMQGS